MTVLRLLPIAPFTVVNLVAGASEIRARDYMLGSLFGMSPGIVLMTMFGDRLGMAARPDLPNLLVVVGGRDCRAPVDLGAPTLVQASRVIVSRIVRRQLQRARLSGWTAGATSRASCGSCARSTPTWSGSRRWSRATAAAT